VDCLQSALPEPFVKPLEKIEMKKTLVAVAAIAAFAGAQAQVTITGGIDYGLTQISTGATKIKYTGGDTNQFNNIKFTASEDLGNGMKASAVYDLGLSYVLSTTNAQANGGNFNRESHIYLSGSMGTISVGRQYVPIFLAATVDPVGLPALSIGQEALNTIFLVQSARNVRNNGAFSYVTPSFSGFTVNYFNSAASSAAESTGTVGATVGYGLKYAAGAISAEYQSQSAGNEGIAYYSDDAVAGQNGAGFTEGTNKTKRQIAAFKYDAGVANFVYIYGSAKNNSLGVVSNYLAVGAPIPGTSISVSAAYNMGTSTVTGASGQSTTGNILKANYGFSKRTNAYFLYGTDKASEAARTTTSTSVGMSHNF